MARIEWVAQRLENWALWRARMEGGGLGFATHSIFTEGPAARGSAYEAPVPIDEIEASITNDAVESLRIGHGHVHKTLHLFYLKGLGIAQTARAMQRAPSTIHAQLASADQLIAIWLNERSRMRQQATQPAPTMPAVRRLSKDEQRQLLDHLAEESAQLEERRRSRQFVGPPRPPFKRARKTLKL
jgi:hypothetical protein